MRSEEIKGKVDFAIITIREDEYRAVLLRFPREDDIVGNRTYTLSRVQLADEEQYIVATARCIDQGGGAAQDLARDIIEDLDPQWFLLVGIAGAIPASEYTLGDVVLATRLNDFSVSAALDGGRKEYATAGGPMHKRVQDLLAHLPARLPQLNGWNDIGSITIDRPPVDLASTNFYGEPGWRTNVQQSLERHFGSHAENRRPLVTTGPIASSDVLIKDTQLIQSWKQSSRHILAVEMELSGVYQASRRLERDYPILAVRGISDVIGFKRNADWTTYACHTAAAFALAFVRSRPISPKGKEVPADKTALVEPRHSTSSVILNLLSQVEPPKSVVLESYTYEALSVDIHGRIVERSYPKTDRFIEELVDGVILEMVEIPGGTFQMGSPKSELRREDAESPQHSVTVRSFYIGKFTVTMAQWAAVKKLATVNCDLSPTYYDYIQELSSIDGSIIQVIHLAETLARYPRRNVLPMRHVPWREAVEFCDRLSIRTGRRYRLPSESEWEFA